MGIKFLRLLLWAMFATAAWAQQPSPTPSPTPTTPNNTSGRPYWLAELPSGKFMIALDSVTSLSQSQYVVDGNARVTEVSVGTSGSVQGRFYYLEPYVPQSPLVSGQSQIDQLKEKVDEALGRVSEDDPNTMVMKNYPTTTHAHTIEFRLGSRADVQKIYSSLENALRTRKDTKFKLK